MSDYESFQVIQESSDNKYFTIIPNVIFELGLRPNEFALYAHYKRVAGDKGCCYQKRARIAEQMKISPAEQVRINKTLRQPRKELGGKALIRVFTSRCASGESNPTQIMIVDIWPDNNSYEFKKVMPNPEESTPNPEESTPNPEEVQKKNSSKKIPKQQQDAAAEASPSSEPSRTSTEQSEGIEERPGSNKKLTELRSNPLCDRLIAHGIFGPAAVRYMQTFCDDLDELERRIDAAEQWVASKGVEVDMARVISKAIAEGWIPKTTQQGPSNDPSWRSSLTPDAARLLEKLEQHPRYAKILPQGPRIFSEGCSFGASWNDPESLRMAEIKFDGCLELEKQV